MNTNPNDPMTEEQRIAFKPTFLKAIGRLGRREVSRELGNEYYALMIAMLKENPHMRELTQGDLAALRELCERIIAE